MKKISISLLLFLLTLAAFGQSHCDVVQQYSSFIKMRIETAEGEQYRVKRIVKTGPKACLPMTDSNIDFVDYLLTNFSSRENEKGLDQIKDSTALQKEYIKRLQADTLFNRVMTEMALKSVEAKSKRDTVSLNRLLDFAVKYFSILRINDKGDYVGKVCTGLNGIKETEPIRRPFVEAFCFSSVLRNYQGESFNMYDEFVKALQEIYTLNLGVEKKERLLRAQGALFMLMRNNQNLKKMLLNEYEKNKEWLPFVLKY